MRETDFTAGEVADMFGVDLKTIHNWVLKGKAPDHWKTPGGHLRFSLDGLKVWAKKENEERKMPIPKCLTS